MIELLLMAAKVIPFDDQVESVEKALREYKENRGGGKSKLAMECALLGLSIGVESKDIAQLISDAAKVKAISERIKSERISS